MNKNSTVESISELQSFNSDKFNERKVVEQQKNQKGLFDIIDEIDRYVNNKLQFDFLGKVKYTEIINRDMRSNDFNTLENIMHNVSRNERKYLNQFFEDQLENRYDSINLKVKVDFNGNVISFASSDLFFTYFLYIV
jgi:hypothetical protein